LGEETPNILSMLSAKLVALLFKPTTRPHTEPHACMKLESSGKPRL